MGEPTGFNVMKRMPKVLTTRYSMNEFEASALCLIICGTEANDLINSIHDLIGSDMSKITCIATSSVIKDLSLSPSKTTTVIKKVNKLKKHLRSRDDEILRLLKVAEQETEESNFESDTTMIVCHQDDKGIHLCTLKANHQLAPSKVIATSTLPVESFDAVLFQ